MRKVLCGILGLVSLTAVGATPEKDKPLDLGVIDVVGVTPLPGSGVAAQKIPANIQTVTSKQLEDTQSLSLAQYMTRFLGSVSVNEAQSNPLQPDIYYRGFAATPILGLPQGISTYVNGVRFNEPFGDSVNWDLISENAIDTMTLFPGSNPVYGLNTLGGANCRKTD